MPTIVVPANLAPCQVTVPDKVPKDPKDPKKGLRKCVRSKVTKNRNGKLVEEDKTGSLHIRPATTMRLTDDEWACLQAGDPTLAKKLIVVQNKRREAMRKVKADKQKQKQAAAVAKPAPKPKFGSDRKKPK